jgi:hypothetical protein
MIYLKKKRILELMSKVCYLNLNFEIKKLRYTKAKASKTQNQKRVATSVTVTNLKKNSLNLKFFV